MLVLLRVQFRLHSSGKQNCHYYMLRFKEPELSFIWYASGQVQISCARTIEDANVLEKKLVHML